MNIIITGPKRCGKSTIISKVIEGFGGSISGFITEFDNRGSDYRELTLRGINGSPSWCAVKWTEGVYKVNHDVFNNVASELIDIEQDLIIIDELGKFEKDCPKLENTVESAFSSSANILAAVRLDAAGWMQQLKSRGDTKVFYVSSDNRDLLPDHLLSILTANGKL